MSPPSALHCAGCGADLGLEPIAEKAELACPGCSIDLRAFAGEAGRLYDCARCGGQFVEIGLLHDLLERRALVGATVPRRPFVRPNELPAVRYVPCPACSKLMGRKNFGGTSGVIVDVCAEHGVWFDAGELPRVLDFVERGGLAEERRRARADAERQKHELAAAKGAPEGEPAASGLGASSLGSKDPTVFHAAPPAWSQGFADDACAVWATLLEQIGRALGPRRP